MAEEMSFYSDNNGIRVTDKRVILNNTTYSLANITSVATSVEEPSRLGPIVTIIIGGVTLLTAAGQSSVALAIFGVIVGAVGYLWYRGCKPIWHLRIASASGETTPLKSLNENWIVSIANAINEAIVHRV